MIEIPSPRDADLGAVAALPHRFGHEILLRHPGAEVHELEALPTPAELEKKLAERSYYELILLRTKDAREKVLAAAEVCDTHGVSFKMVPDLLEIRMGEVMMDHHLGLPAYRIQHTSMTRANFAAKRTFDVLFVALLLLVTAPVWLLICLAIRLDSKGPVFFTQKRYGYKGHVFSAFKFRTMVADAKKDHGRQGPQRPEGRLLQGETAPRDGSASAERFSSTSSRSSSTCCAADERRGPRPLA